MLIHSVSRFQGPSARSWWIDRVDPRLPGKSNMMNPRSSANRFLKPVASSEASGPIRLDLVLRVRAEIGRGTYDTEEKWEIALDRLLDRMERD